MKQYTLSIIRACMVVIIHNALCCSLLGLLVFFVLKLFLIQSNSDGVLRVFLGLWHLNCANFLA